MCLSPFDNKWPIELFRSVQSVELTLTNGDNDDNVLGESNDEMFRSVNG